MAILMKHSEQYGEKFNLHFFLIICFTSGRFSVSREIILHFVCLLTSVSWSNPARTVYMAKR